MITSAIKQQLHQFIDNLEADRAQAIYTLFANEMDTDLQRKILIRQERDKYLKGEGRSYTTEQVKAMALDKAKRDGL